MALKSKVVFALTAHSYSFVLIQLGGSYFHSLLAYILYCVKKYPGIYTSVLISELASQELIK